MWRCGDAAQNSEIIDSIASSFPQSKPQAEQGEQYICLARHAAGTPVRDVVSIVTSGAIYCDSSRLGT